MTSALCRLISPYQGGRGSVVKEVFSLSLFYLIAKST